MQYFELTPLTHLSLADLDLDALSDYLAAHGDYGRDHEKSQLLTHWGLLHEGHPTVAGMLLFGHEPQRYIPYARIDAARFSGTDWGVLPVEAQNISGQLLEVIASAEIFLQSVVPGAVHEVLREGVINAVVHRDYSIQQSIRLRILEDRIQIHSPGCPPPSVTLTNMGAGVHVLRNPRIYTRLASADFMPYGCMGIARIYGFLREQTGYGLSLSIGAEAQGEVIFSIRNGLAIKP